ncbi:hypothetical protein [Chitinophaga sp.]|uniref:hypothetical protein n=1 Tax=Chitinophaga sp. TaxID=1869181 RepID=UPI0031E034F9
MKKFRKKPVEIEAMQLTIDNIYEVQDWANSIMPSDKQITISFLEEDDLNWRPAGLNIPTKEGIMLCCFNDYLIKEPFPTDDRMFYPCKPDMFDLTYEPIN